MKATITTIGDEILIGQIVDTNSASISRKLNAAGITIATKLSIGDTREAIVEAVERAMAECDITIITGGLGPTKDDITKKALADLSGATGWTENQEQLEIIYRILHSRGLDVLEINRAQALVPDTCEVIPNRLGTAPIMVFRFPQERFGHSATLYSLPGVPHEAIGALPEILEDIKGHYTTSDIYHRSVMTFGIAESALAKMIEEWEDNLPENMHLAYLPNLITGVKLRLSIYGGAKEDHERLISEKLEQLANILGDNLYSLEEDTLQEYIGKLLRRHGKTVSCAESCTGGLISSLFTSVPGSSEYFLGSVTSYANIVKQNVLGVPAEVIAAHGAVSSECVSAMAEGVRRLTGSDYSVATSGIAGPGGGSDQKPVGTVWIGVSSHMGTETFSLRFNSDRKRNIERFTANALNLLRITIVNVLNN